MEENKNSREIDVLKLATLVLAEKKKLAIAIVIAAIVGVTVALNTEKEYTSTVILAPELTGAGAISDNISDLASMVGVNLKNSSSSIDAIYPEIYPDVLSSSDFIVKLFPVKVSLSKTGVQKSYYDHLTQDVHVPFWSYPKIWITSIFKKKDKTNSTSQKLNSFWLTKDQDNACSAIRGRLNCKIDKKTSVITINFTDNDPLVSAQMADTIQQRLQQYIIIYRTKKARNDLAYSEKLCAEARNNYKKAQEQYSSYADANQDVILESFIAKRDEKENNMQLLYNVYNQLCQQVQAARAKVQERTPAFTTIQKATVPLKASNTPRSQIVLLFIILGIIVDSAWVLFLRKIVNNIFHKK